MNSPDSMPVGQLSAEARGSFLVRACSHLALAIGLFVGIAGWLFLGSHRLIFPMKKLPVLLAILTAMPFARAREIQGVPVPPSVPVAGQNLALNGAGLRTFTLLLVPIKIYVAAFYTPGPLRSEAEVLASPGPMQFNFTFLRAVGASDVSEAWTSQFANSVTYTYPGYEKDRDNFIRMFGALKSGGVQMVQFIGTDTLVYDQGTMKGRITGRDFQKAFLSLWFGSTPVAADLKDALLGGGKS